MFQSDIRVSKHLPIETYQPLNDLGVCRHVFINRIADIDVVNEKPEVLRRLEAAHRAIRDGIGMGDWPFVSADQVHGSRVAAIDGPVGSDLHYQGVDGFITNQQRVALGVYVADCCAVYLADPKRSAVGLVHSGKRGTEAGIAVNAIQSMQRVFGSEPSDLIVQLSPCIRPPHYEIDFAAEIREQCRTAGVKQVHDYGICTACDLTSYYSYRAEKGKTGRMLAIIGLI
jgi:polyphenol oxidase